MILTADVGGTKTHLGCFEPTGETWSLIANDRVPTGAYPNVEAILTAFLAGRNVSLTAACIGVAAPVVDGVSEAVNLPWPVHTNSLQQLLRLEPVWLINDLEALAYGVAHLAPHQYATLAHGHAIPHGVMAVIAAGTSLGEASLTWDAQGYHAWASEGGHADFAPRNTVEWEFAQFLAKRMGHVSWARVLSGQGLVHLYEFLRMARRTDEPVDPIQTTEPALMSAHIVEAARVGRSALCDETVTRFVSMYGAEAGNLALRTLPRGGVYLGGGIAPHLLWKLQDGTFMDAFVDKGRLRPLLATLPVHVVMHEHAALIGAAYYARQRLTAPNAQDMPSKPAKSRMA